MNAFDTLPVPYPYLRIGHLGEDLIRDRERILDGVGTHVVLEASDIEAEIKNGLDLVVVEPSVLDLVNAPLAPAGFLETLIACEGAGVPTVLHVRETEELARRATGVVSHIVTTDASVHQSAMALMGSERVLLVNSTVDPHQVLLEGSGDPEALTQEAVTRRRQIIAEYSPKAQADAVAEWLGFTVEPLPMVTAIVVSRKAENLAVTLANLQRQQYSNLDVLLTIDPMYESDARRALAAWDIPVRVEASQPGGTLADRLNQGILSAYGELVTVIEENALYGPHHITDLVQATLYSGAPLVGKASWYVYEEAKDRMVPRAPGTQRSFGQLPALGTMMLRRETARQFGFTRHATGINWPLAQRVAEAGGSIYSVHAFDTVLPKKGQNAADLYARTPSTEAFPFGNY